MWSARQQHCLQGIGIRLWRERGAGAAETPPPAEDDLGGETMERVAAEIPATETGTDLLLARENKPVPIKGDQPGGGVSTPTSLTPAAYLDGWDSLNAAIHACEACALAAGCTQKVPGVGNRDADLMIVGEGPGHDEDIRGEPFVGRSGQLLDRMLAAIGLDREQVFITNIVKCRPPDNRDPKADEAASCRAFLDAQIRLVAPKVILSVGRISAHNLLECNDAVGKLIKRSHRLPGSELPVKVTYHPAYLLRNPPAKAIAWDDLKQVHRMLQ